MWTNREKKFIYFFLLRIWIIKVKKREKKR